MANPDAHPEVMRRPAAAIAPRAGRKQRVFKGTPGSRSAAQKKQQIVTCDFCRPGRACCSSTSISPRDGYCVKPHASLVRTCWQIHNETMPIFYGQNAFIVGCLIFRPYEADNFFPFQMRLATMCLMKTMVFRDACLCGHWKNGKRRSVEISGGGLAASCFGPKTVRSGPGGYLPLPPRSRQTHDAIMRGIISKGQSSRNNPCLHCASRYFRNRWEVV
ncbi:hypothetical protein PG990_001459 [Apiospora arundinis]